MPLINEDIKTACVEKADIKNGEWDNRAKTYDKLNWVNEEKVLNNIVTMCGINKNSNVLDLGTGTGIVAKRISQYCNSVIGIDTSKKMLEIAQEKRNANNINYVNVGINEFKKEKRIDCIVARMVFHHIKDIQKVFNKCYSLLSPGGVLVVCEGIPQEGTEKWYEDMFKLKEDRITLTVGAIIEKYLSSGFKSIKKTIIVQENMSIENWLENANIIQKNANAIYEKHLYAPEYVKEAYNIRHEMNGDILMNWRTAIIRGVK